MTLRPALLLFSAVVLSSGCGSSTGEEHASDWHPSRVTEYVVPVDGTPPPWKFPDSLPDPFGIVAGPAGTMWFTELQFSRIGRISADGHVSQFTIPGGDTFLHADPNAIVLGGDGAMWFATQTGLGRTATDGEMSNYPSTSLSEGFLSKIAADNDGVWVLSNRLGHVGRDGVMHWYERPGGLGNMVESIFAGPQHQVWALTQNFLGSMQTTNPWSFAVSKVLPGGTLGTPLTFSLPKPNAGLSTVTSIIAVSDGSFWLSEGGGQSGPPFGVNIDQLFADGRCVRRANLPGAYHVIEGPNRTVLAQGSDYIAKIERDGTLTTYYPPSTHGGLVIGGVATGPHGTVWFTYSDGTGRIEELSP